MRTTKMIRLLQMFFDGNFLYTEDIIRVTGCSKEEAKDIAEAIKQLNSLSFDQIEALNK